MPSIEHGPSGSSSPVPKRRERSPRTGRAPVRQSFFVRVHRRAGGKDDIGRADKDQLHILRKFGAIFVETTPAETMHYVWGDWYRVPITGDETLWTIYRVLESRRIFDGPHYGVGQVNPVALGSGPEKKVRGDKLTEQRYVALQRERKADRERFSLHRIFGSGFPFHLIADAPREEFLGDSFGPVAGEWPLPDAAWFSLVKRFPEYERAFRLCSQQYAFWAERMCDENASEEEIATAVDQFNRWGEWKERLEGWTIARVVKPEEVWVTWEEEIPIPGSPHPWLLTATWWNADGTLECRSHFSFRTEAELKAKKKELRAE